MHKPSLHRPLAIAVALALLTPAAAFGADATTQHTAPTGSPRDIGRSTRHERRTSSSRHVSGATRRRHAHKPTRTHSHRGRKHHRKAKRHHPHHSKPKVLASPTTPTTSTGSTATSSPPTLTDTTPSPTGAPSPPTAAKQPSPSPACTQTVASVASATSAVAAAGAEAVVCLTAGGYGPLELAGKHSGTVTIEPVPGSEVSLEGVSVAAGSSGITVHNFTISGGVSLAAGDSHITIDHNDINGQGPGGDGEGVETLAVNCSAPNAPTYSGCTTTTPDTYLTINGNKIHGYGEGDSEDAIHLNDWEHVTITANDIYNLEEHGNHTDAMQSVFGGHYMTFAYNYEHDNQAQGFFISDGDASEVTVTENLFLTNNNLGEDEYNVQVFDTTGFTMTNNTVWDGQADIIRAEGAAETLTATVNHNVEQNFDILNEGGPEYELGEDYDIFGEAPFDFTEGPHSQVDANPDFANPASGDYELASNPNGIGIDWQPSEYVYGPTGD